MRPESGGTGGAARAVAFALRQMEIPYQFVSRHPHGENQTGYEELATRHSPLPTLLVNATPVGMYPDTDRTPFPLPTTHCPLPTLFLYDLTYNPSPTLLMRQAAALGAKTKDGLEMLRLQADLSWQIWQQN